jgi:hypothetical protein
MRDYLQRTQQGGVYSYKHYEPKTDSEDVRPVKATAEALAIIGAKPIEGTGEVVDESMLAGLGFYRPEVGECASECQYSRATPND